MRDFSFGGGVQSMAVMVLQATRQLPNPFEHYIFSMVGRDSEAPGTLAYYDEYAKPFADEFGISLIEVERTMKRTGEVRTLYEFAMAENKTIPLPMYMSGNKAPGHRTCTSNFKIAVIADWQKKNGATNEAPGVIGLGISVDEMERARTDSGIDWQTLEYPLLDLRLSRNECIKIIKSVGLPVPPKSACWFCPFHKRAYWIDLRRDNPQLFEKAVKLEKRQNEKRGSLGKDFMTLHRDGFLDQAVAEMDRLIEEPEDNCESGYCMT